MAYMTWSEAYSIGVPSIDKEHQELVDIGNQLHERLRASAPEDDVKRIFAQLSECTILHIRNEEKTFVGTNYPRAALHTRKHQHLMVILACFETGFDRTGRRVSIADQMNFLRDWLLDHIATEDRLLGQYLNAQADAASFAIATP